MLANDKFSGSFVDFSANIGHIAKASVMSSLSVNLMTSGSLSTIWGLINCLQIVAHFPLINIVQPANSQYLFQIMQELSAFEMLPIEDKIDQIQSDMSIFKDNYALSANFADFDLDSTNVISNLQVYSLVLFLLVALPVLLLLSWSCLYWFKRGHKIIKWITDAIFFSLYIRFILEGFLELSLACLIRFQNFKFDTQSGDTFNSTMSMVLMMILFFTLLATFMVNTFGERIVKSLKFQHRLGEFTLGVRLNNWKTRLYPSLFMSRRLLYAAVLVNYLPWGNLQIQSVMVKTFLFTIYMLHIRPYDTKLANRVEVANEILTQLATYCMVIFEMLKLQPI